MHADADAEMDTETAPPATHCRTCSNALSADEQDCGAEDCDPCWEAQSITRHMGHAADFRGWLRSAATEAARGNDVYPARVAEHELRYAYNRIEQRLRNQDVVRAEVSLHLDHETVRQCARVLLERTARLAHVATGLANARGCHTWTPSWEMWTRDARAEVTAVRARLDKALADTWARDCRAEGGAA